MTIIESVREHILNQLIAHLTSLITVPIAIEWVKKKYFTKKIYSMELEYGTLTRVLFKYLEALKITGVVPLYDIKSISLSDAENSNDKMKYMNGLLEPKTGYELDCEIKVEGKRFKIYTIKRENMREANIKVEYDNPGDEKILLKKIYQVGLKMVESRTKVFIPDDEKMRWTPMFYINNKYYKNLFLSEKNEKQLKDTLNKFVKSEENKILGVPKKLCILLHGKPGTGKTATTYAISNELHRDIYRCDLRYSIESDLVGYKNIIYAIDDIERQLNNLDVTKQKVIKKLMDLFDGYILSDGAIVVITSNDISKIDETLLRPGRIDLTLEYGLCDEYQYKKIKSLCPKVDIPDYDKMTTSEIIQKIMQN